MDLGLKNATAVIAGGTKGMGRAIAESLASEGASVAVLARDQGVIDETVSALSQLGAPDALGLATDLTSQTAVGRSMTAVSERWGSLNILVNAVGPVEVGIGRFADIDDIEWQATFDIGVLSAVRTVRAALPLLRNATWARVVNLSAHSTKRQSIELVAYTAAKAALTSVTKNLSALLASDGILVNTVSPGSFLSEGMKGYLKSLSPDRNVDSDSLVDAMRVISEDYGHPALLGRAADPREIGPLVAFLCSPANTYITGADINIDGGSDFT
jgi:3-oxoacyl-[acyl-carrier protein] reductase